jgi:hypothetical protein
MGFCGREKKKERFVDHIMSAWPQASVFAGVFFFFLQV